MQAVEQAREQSGCHQAPSLSHPGGEGRRWWAGLAIFILLLGCGLHETMQTEESSGLGQAQGWDWHGAGQVLTGSWQSVLKTQALQQAPNPNGRRSFPRLPCFPRTRPGRLSSAATGCRLDNLLHRLWFPPSTSSPFQVPVLFLRSQNKSPGRPPVSEAACCISVHGSWSCGQGLLAPALNVKQIVNGSG